MIWRSKSSHFFFFLFVILFTVLFQAYYLSRSHWNLFKIDFVTLLVIYSCFEHRVLPTTVRIFFSAILLELMSAVPKGLYLTYFLLCLAIVSFFSRHVVVYKKRNQLWMTALLLSLKYVLVYVVLSNDENAEKLTSFIEFVFPQFAMTCLLAIPLYRLLAQVDMLFEFRPYRARSSVT